jgi:predicted DCC family thiol-disulfide oxidoreductase YuxK
VPERLFYDGSCALCHWAVRFVVSRDVRGDAFRFAPLASEAFGKATAAAAGRADFPDSLVVETGDGRYLTKSAAVIHVMRRLPFPWPALGALARVVPPFVLDAVYDLVARTRYRLFGRTENACPVVPAELRSRFDL